MLTTSGLASHLTHGLLAASRSSPGRKSIPAEAPAAEHIAHALQPQFSSNPTDIRQVVDKSSLADDQKKMTVDRIAAWHPRGLKVSLVG